MYHFKDELHSRTVAAVLQKDFFEKRNDQKTNIDSVDEGYDHMDLIEHDNNRIENGVQIL